MNRRKMIQSLALTALGASACLSGTSRAAAEGAPVAIRILKPIHVGESLSYDSGNLQVTFLSMIDDSRCPIDAVCTSEGDAEVVLQIKVGTKKPRKYWLHTKTHPKKLVLHADVAKTGTTGISKTYVIDIATLNPFPITGKKFKQSEYLLGLHIATVI